MAGEISLTGTDILILEDEALLRKRLAAYLERCGAAVTAAGNLAEARRCLQSLRFDFALIDINLPDGESFELLREGAFPAVTGVVVMTSEGGVTRAVEAMRLGAGDYLAKPFDQEELPLVFERLRQSRNRDRLREHARLRETTTELFFGPALGPVQAMLQKIIQTDIRLGERLPPVLIEGETGSGKTALARWLHQQGPRAAGPLVEVNCSALPEALAESELFGHERGAFTDARSARVGLFEAAHGGTLFLDEIASLSLGIQAKVLTALEDRKIRRVGGNRPIPVDARLIAASNRPLPDLVARGEFREDLYHRLNLLWVRLPSLRQRAGDIPALAEHLLASLGRRYRTAPPVLTPEGRARLQSYGWPGNVRELAHELERALILCEGGDLDFSHLPVHLAPNAPEGSPQGPAPAATGGSAGPDDWFKPGFRFPESGFNLEEAINRMVRQALDQAGGNVSKAARLLGVTRDYVRYRLGPPR